MRKVIFVSGMVIALVGFALVGMASADILYVGSKYTSPIYILDNGNPKTTAGGSIDPSTLNGTPLEYMYCLNQKLDIPVGKTYADTVVTTNGVIGGGSSSSTVNNAAQIAWLLSNYSVSGQGESAYALQVAIWHEENPNITIDSNQSTAHEVALYDAYISNPGSGNVGDFLWITPEDASGKIYQEQVGSVPEPSSLILLGLGLAALAVFGLKRATA